MAYEPPSYGIFSGALFFCKCGGGGGQNCSQMNAKPCRTPSLGDLVRRVL